MAAATRLERNNHEKVTQPRLVRVSLAAAVNSAMRPSRLVSKTSSIPLSCASSAARTGAASAKSIGKSRYFHINSRIRGQSSAPNFIRRTPPRAAMSHNARWASARSAPQLKPRGAKLLPYGANRDALSVDKL